LHLSIYVPKIIFLCADDGTIDMTVPHGWMLRIGASEKAWQGHRYGMEW
jgi:hypothetical protein